MDTIILASGSPRRRELLSRVKLPFKVVSPNLVEEYTAEEPVRDLVVAIARRKAEIVVDMFKAESPRWVLGVDTVVEVGGKLLGKPVGVEEAEAMVLALSGRVHRVYSGLALLVEKGREMETECVATEVKFRDMSPEEMKSYIETGEWAGAAGAYRIQERGSFFVEWIKGSYSNVVGLPLEAFYGMLKRTGYRF
jgi:septum formation protein